MKKHEIWDFVSGNLISLSTVVAGILVIILQQLDKMSQTDVETAILTIVVLLATSEIVDKSKKLDRLESIIIEGFSSSLKMANSTTIKKFTIAEEGFNYMASKVQNAKIGIDHVAFAPPIPRWSEQSKLYEKSVVDALEANHIKYRYIAGIKDKRGKIILGRSHKIIRLLENAKIKRYFPAVYHLGENSFAGFSFMIFDQEEIVIYYPSLIGSGETVISIRNVDVLEQYTGYFARLWTEAEIIDLEKAKKLQEEQEG